MMNWIVTKIREEELAPSDDDADKSHPEWDSEKFEEDIKVILKKYLCLKNCDDDFSKRAT